MPLGGGASCAARLRRQDEWSEIIMFERGPFVSFANCGLPYYIGNVIQNEDDLLIADTELFRERFNIDADNKTVLINDLNANNEYVQAYDELVHSPGSYPIKPPLPGIDLPGIYTIRSVPDSNQVRSWIETKHVDRAIVSPVSLFPMWLVKEMKTEGILKEFTLGQGESIILKAGISSDIMLLATGEVDVIELDQISRHLSSSDEKRRPVKLLNNTSITFYARTPSTLFRIDQEYLDFYDSWFAMIEYISHERQTLRIY